MTEPKRKLSILVPDLPWLPSEEKGPDLKAWDEACEAAMKRSLAQAEQDTESPS
jgi:hypothetical protein